MPCRLRFLGSIHTVDSTGVGNGWIPVFLAQNRKLWLFFAVTVLASFAAPQAKASVAGDIDGDGRATLSDLVILQQVTRSERTLNYAQNLAADVNKDGIVDAGDVAALVDILLERFPPTVVYTTPTAFNNAKSFKSVVVHFNKPILANEAVTAGISFSGAGNDLVFGSADDVAVHFTASVNGPDVTLSFVSPLDSTGSLLPGVYKLHVGPPIADVKGRQTSVFEALYLVLSEDPTRDSDGDGIPDLREIQLGTNPLLADTDGDGVDDKTEIDQGSNPLDPTSIPGISGAQRTISSTVISYINLPGEPNNPQSSTNQRTVVSSIVSYANLPVESGNVQAANQKAVFSPVVAYVNLPTEPNNPSSGTDAGKLTNVISPITSYSNLPTETQQTETTETVESPLISYSNTTPTTP